MDSCLWATVHFRKSEDDFKRVIQNTEVQKIQTIFETVQAQISNLKNRDHEIHGFDERVDWTRGQWMTYSLLDDRIATQFS